MHTPPPVSTAGSSGSSSSNERSGTRAPGAAAAIGGGGGLLNNRNTAAPSRGTHLSDGNGEVPSRWGGGGAERSPGIRYPAGATVAAGGGGNGSANATSDGGMRPSVLLQARHLFGPLPLAPPPSHPRPHDGGGDGDGDGDGGDATPSAGDAMTASTAWRHLRSAQRHRRTRAARRGGRGRGEEGVFSGFRRWLRRQERRLRTGSLTVASLLSSSSPNPLGKPFSPTGSSGGGRLKTSSHSSSSSSSSVDPMQGVVDRYRELAWRWYLWRLAGCPHPSQLDLSLDGGEEGESGERKCKEKEDGGHHLPSFDAAGAVAMESSHQSEWWRRWLRTVGERLECGSLPGGARAGSLLSSLSSSAPASQHGVSLSFRNSPSMHALHSVPRPREERRRAVAEEERRRARATASAAAAAVESQGTVTDAPRQGSSGGDDESDSDGDDGDCDSDETSVDCEVLTVLNSTGWWSRCHHALLSTLSRGGGVGIAGMSASALLLRPQRQRQRWRDSLRGRVTAAKARYHSSSSSGGQYQYEQSHHHLAYVDPDWRRAVAERVRTVGLSTWERPLGFMTAAATTLAEGSASASNNHNDAALATPSTTTTTTTAGSSSCTPLSALDTAPTVDEGFLPLPCFDPTAPAATLDAMGRQHNRGRNDTWRYGGSGSSSDSRGSGPVRGVALAARLTANLSRLTDCCARQEAADSQARRGAHHGNDQTTPDRDGNTTATEEGAPAAAAAAAAGAISCAHGSSRLSDNSAPCGYDYGDGERHTGSSSTATAADDATAHYRTEAYLLRGGTSTVSGHLFENQRNPGLVSARRRAAAAAAAQINSSGNTTCLDVTTVMRSGVCGCGVYCTSVKGAERSLHGSFLHDPTAFPTDDASAAMAAAAATAATTSTGIRHDPRTGAALLLLRPNRQASALTGTRLGEQDRRKQQHQQQHQSGRQQQNYHHQQQQQAVVSATTAAMAERSFQHELLLERLYDAYIHGRRRTTAEQQQLHLHADRGGGGGDTTGHLIHAAKDTAVRVAYEEVTAVVLSGLVSQAVGSRLAQVEGAARRAASEWTLRSLVASLLSTTGNSTTTTTTTPSSSSPQQQQQPHKHTTAVVTFAGILAHIRSGQPVSLSVTASGSGSGSGVLQLDSADEAVLARIEAKSGSQEVALDFAAPPRPLPPPPFASTTTATSPSSSSSPLSSGKATSAAATAAVSTTVVSYSPMTYAQLATLRPGVWLNDQVINNYLQLLCESATMESATGVYSSGNAVEVVATLGTHFYAKVESELATLVAKSTTTTNSARREEGPLPQLPAGHALLRWLRRRTHLLLPYAPSGPTGVTGSPSPTTTTTTVHTVLVPVNLFGQHWALAVWHKDTDAWYFHDSLHRSPNVRHEKGERVLQELSHVMQECRRHLCPTATGNQPYPHPILPPPRLLIALPLSDTSSSSGSRLDTLAPYQTAAALHRAAYEFDADRRPLLLKRAREALERDPDVDAVIARRKRGGVGVSDTNTNSNADSVSSPSAASPALAEMDNTDVYWFTPGMHLAPQQRNGDDCGVFVCQAAWCAAQGVAVSFSAREAAVLRRVMTCELWERRLLRRLPTDLTPGSMAVNAAAE